MNPNWVFQLIQKIWCFGTVWTKHGQHLQLQIQIKLNIRSGSWTYNYLPISVPVDLQSVVQPQEILSALIEKVAGVLLSKQAELLLCGHWCLIWEYPQQKHQNLQQICTTSKKNPNNNTTTGRQVLQPTVKINIQKWNQNYSTC